MQQIFCSYLTHTHVQLAVNFTLGGLALKQLNEQKSCGFKVNSKAVGQNAYSLYHEIIK